MTTIIQSTLVSGANRLVFLPKYFGRQMIAAENIIYNTLNRLCNEYKGGYWSFYELSNEGFYMAPEFEGKFTLFVDCNGYSAAVSADVAGIISTLFTLNHLCCVCESDDLINAYYLLLDYAGEHAEARRIFAAID